MEVSKEENLPKELRSFLLSPGGHSLIIRGNAGTGKTTLALQIIEELSEIDNSFYFSTRVSDSVILNQFPWLARRLYGDKEGESILREVMEGVAENIEKLKDGQLPEPPELEQNRYW
ncbi:MAG: gas vesicle protein GvpD P-loop domain-containing protein, partial [Methanomassiliicoccales archaeon]